MNQTPRLRYADTRLVEATLTFSDGSQLTRTWNEWERHLASEGFADSSLKISEERDRQHGREPLKLEVVS